MEEILLESYAGGPNRRCETCAKVYMLRTIINTEGERRTVRYQLNCDCGERWNGPVHEVDEETVEKWRKAIKDLKDGKFKPEPRHCPRCGQIYTSKEVPPQEGELSRTQLLCDCKGLLLYSATLED